MRAIARLAVLVVVLSSALFAAQQPNPEKAVWSQEEAYWQYVKANDMDRYRTLWHSDFLGWPYSDPEPAGKDHITDWIVAHTGKGETLKSYELERLKTRVSNSYAIVTYRVHLTWSDRDGKDHASVLRVIHTWVSDGRTWYIISGMGAPTNADGK